MKSDVENSVDLIKKFIFFTEKKLEKIKKYHKSHSFFKKSEEEIRDKARELVIRLKKTDSVSDRKEIIEITSKLNKSVGKNFVSNYKKIVRELKIKLRELEIGLEFSNEEEGEKIYDKKDVFDFYKDLKKIIKKSNVEIFIIDPYIDKKLLDNYLDDINENVDINILTNTNNPKKSQFIRIANMFKTQYPNSIQVRETLHCHDRAIFFDKKEGWVMGQSIKDAAKNKPTYLIRLKNPGRLETLYDILWSNGNVLI